MANFPNSVTSFAARANGQTIDASHVGDLQDEVNAIEDGYINGTARLNSSNSTVANLTVSGGSTFAGTVTFSAQPRCALQRNSTQSLTNNTWTDVNSFQVEEIDVASLHSTATNPERITVPAGSSGAYWFFGQIDFDSNSTGMRGARFFKNSTLAIATKQYQTVSGNVTVIGTEYLVVMDGGDYMTLQAIQQTGSTLSLGTNNLTQFGCMRIG